MIRVVIMMDYVGFLCVGLINGGFLNGGGNGMRRLFLYIDDIMLVEVDFDFYVLIE